MATVAHTLKQDESVAIIIKEKLVELDRMLEQAETMEQIQEIEIKIKQVRD